MHFLRNILLALALPLVHAVANYDTFHITPTLYRSNSNWDKVCTHFFGDDALVADFQDFKDMNAIEFEATLDDLGIPETHNAKRYFVQWKGNQIVPTLTKYAYFFEDNGGPAPSYFQAVTSYEGVNLGVTTKYGYIICKTQSQQTQRKLEEGEEEPQTGLRQ